MISPIRYISHVGPCLTWPSGQACGPVLILALSNAGAYPGGVSRGRRRWRPPSPFEAQVSVQKNYSHFTSSIANRPGLIYSLKSFANIRCLIAFSGTILFRKPQYFPGAVAHKPKRRLTRQSCAPPRSRPRPSWPRQSRTPPPF